MTHPHMDLQVGDRVRLDFMGYSYEGEIVEDNQHTLTFRSDTYGHQSVLHDASGRLPPRTGRWISKTNDSDGTLTRIGPRPKRTSGFGAFVKKVEVNG